MAGFGIFAVDVAQGQVALSPIPGRSGNYEADLSAILKWGPDMVLTMITGAELDRMGASDLGDDLAMADIDWIHLPVEDFGAPDEAVQAKWVDVGMQAQSLLAGGGKILVHCFGGCGRSGMIALRLMVEAGERPDTALARLRAVRPCAVERDAQYEWASA